VVYQLYPTGSGADGANDAHDGNGAGDLRGVIARIPYLAALGIDAIWLSPFDPSALADFDEMASELHAHGIKVIVDFAPDDTSNSHPWFTEALATPPGSPTANRSVFRDGLGQVFTFDLLEAYWDAGEFLRVITDNLAAAQLYGASASWVLSGHGATPRRACAAALLMLALPGSAYLSQGEELGRSELADILAVSQAQEHDLASTLNLYRQALAWRRKLQAAENLEWMPGTNEHVLHFGRPGGWRSVTNFGPRTVPLPPGTVIVSSAPLEAGLLSADTTAWIVAAS
jgi:alpha-glucosidase